MKFSTNKHASYIRLTLTLYAALLLCAATAAAGVRQEAESALTSLHQNAGTQKYPDDMKSLDLVFEVAQRYFSDNNMESADRFYLLALQKARVIESMLMVPESMPAPEVPLPAEAAPQQEALPLPEAVVVSSPPDPLQPIEPAAGAIAAAGSSRLVGSKGVYTVVKADTVRLVAAKLGVSQQHLRSMNGLDARAYLKVGQKLAYNNLKIIPRQMKDGIIINIPDRTLYYFQQGSLVTSLPVALGSVIKNEKYVWQTPVGKFKITEKMKDPTWTVPPSIQTEMVEQGKEVVTTLPPGPENPLGKYAIRTSIPGILIHSTTRPSSIYSFSSHGCIRLSPNQMEEFFPQIKVNTKGEIIYKPVKLAVTENGRVFLEVHQDVYKKSASLIAEARQMVESQKLTERVDWEKFNSVVKRKSGVAEDISLTGAESGPVAQSVEAAPRRYAAAIMN